MTSLPSGAPAGFPSLALPALVGVIFLLFIMLVIVVLRLMTATRRLSHAGEGHPAFMADALQAAVSRMREQERALAARAEASELLSDQVIDGLPSGLLVTDRAGVPQRINPAGARLLAIDRAENAGPALAALWPALGAPGAALHALIDECLASEAPALRRTLVLHPHHTQPGAGPRHIGAGVSPLRDAHGTVTGAICLFTDLTAVVDLEEQLRLKDSLSRLGELTAGLAHEFRNGLATIHGYARLLSPATPPADYRTYVESLRAETESLTEIVANFLAFARPAHDTLLPTPLRPIVERAMDDGAADARAHGGDISAGGEFGEIDADDVMLRQALSNLVRNAVEACVEAGRVPRVQITGTVDAAAGMQRITVSDSGPGVPESLRDKVFHPFFTTRGRGTGLGLALVQKIIVSHNGRVALGTASGGGAEFAIVLPLSRREN
ncbi:MAG: ATP-binding protein [Acidobacteriota bacterium]|nr:ATP-binding protein [Acidobacteriota bacterium]